MNTPPSHYTDDHRITSEDLFNASSYEELAQIALGELKSLGNAVSIVCGPITTGGRGSIKDNVAVFGATIKKLSETNILFNQVPYEGSIARLRQIWHNEGNTGYCMPILDVFYAQLFESGNITKAYFIPGWESSFGARWEHNEMKLHGVEIVYLTDEWIDSII
ncbi:MAG: hypothetical protein JWO50_706 [Candidatus Kaiserbacteria bacterium]|nr:hypothetical protein [Candidatus Kaiserbacteria bacterium]